MSGPEIFLVTDEHELFVDLHRVERLDGLTRILHPVQKHPDNPLLSPARPWEVMGPQLYGSVIRDERTGRFRMWYLGGDNGPDFRYRTCGCLAESEDGVRWRRPDLEVYEYHTAPRTNIVLRAHATTGWAKGRFDGFSVLEDPMETAPARRYKSLSWQCNTAGGKNKYDPAVRYASGVYLGWSGDGLHWSEHPEPVHKMADGIGDTSFNFLCDTRHRRYVAFLKILKGRNRQRRQWRDGRWLNETDQSDSEAADANPEQLGVVYRHRGLSVSDDFFHWSPVREILSPDGDDPPDLEWYNNTGFVCGSQYLGLIEAYYPATTDTIDIQLISSRDGLNWERCFDRSPFIPNGQFDHDWDWGMLLVPGSPPVRVGDQLYFYYTGEGIRHQTPYPLQVPARGNPCSRGIGLATLRVDGFVSVRGGAGGGRLWTNPLRLEGTKLEINANAAGGRIRAGILGEDGRLRPGFALEDCTPLSADATGCSIRWGERESLPEVCRTHPVRLVFEVADADLYAYWSR